ncbi:hypothetical protein ACERZ8_07795 [Tateyamaria armeniaca]|uniref:Uncharacterized protein n=1 Tax=Tateyamaria armeniaca TaxID=2518930 RepID=A0ABW8US66_9RHOB
MFTVLFFLGATLIAGALGFIFGQRWSAPEAEEQTELLGAEIVRLRRRAHAAERDAAQNKAIAARKLRRIRIAR